MAAGDDGTVGASLSSVLLTLSPRLETRVQIESNPVLTARLFCHF